MKIVINKGLVIDPKNRIYSKLNVAIEDGKISEISKQELKGDSIINADGLVVAPGFIDIHMHEDTYDIQKDKFNIGIFECMLKMGVTTAIGGNCGIGTEEPNVYLDAVDRIGIPINFGMLLPHGILRNKVNEKNKYKKASMKNIIKMQQLAQQYLDKGCLGISFGIRYIPGITKEEFIYISQGAKKNNKLIAAHIRDDAENVIEAALEFIKIGEELGLPIQISHIGSMGAYGQMNELLSLIDYYKAKGVNVSSDCYPYNAFSTGIGETTYDEGFLERYNTTYESIEIVEGQYKGKRLSKELFYKLRKEAPKTLTVAHVMKENEIELAMIHPDVIIASDGILNNLQGHPRASGTFPRFIKQYVKEKSLLSLASAIEKITYLPAKRLGINKGTLDIGSDGDMVIFNYDEIVDQGTFQNPISPPKGIKYVIMNGKIAVENNKIIHNALGKSIRK